MRKDRSLLKLGVTKTETGDPLWMSDQNWRWGITLAQQKNVAKMILAYVDDGRDEFTVELGPMLGFVENFIALTIRVDELQDEIKIMQQAADEQINFDVPIVEGKPTVFRITESKERKIHCPACGEANNRLLPIGGFSILCLHCKNTITGKIFVADDNSEVACVTDFDFRGAAKYVSGWSLSSSIKAQIARTSKDYVTLGKDLAIRLAKIAEVAERELKNVSFE